MKKLSFLMAMFVSLVMVFTACETKPDPTNKPDQGEKIEIDTTGALAFTSAVFYDYGSTKVLHFFPSFSMYFLQGMTGDVTYDPETGKCTGNGYLVQLNQAFVFTENNMPVTKDFAPFELTEDNYIKEVFPGASGNVQLFEVVDGKLDKNNALDTRNFKAQVIKNGDVVEYALEGIFDGEKHVFYFKGQPEVINMTGFYRDAEEEGEKCEEVETYAQAEVIYYGETGLLPINVIEVVLIDAKQTSFANFYCYGSLDDEENVYGTFKVATKHEVGTMAKGPGIFVSEESAYAYPSFIARNYSQNAGGDYYFVDGGSLTIEEGKISFELTSVNGSKFTTTYQGKIDIKSYEEAYPSQAPRRAPAVKNVLNAPIYELAPYMIF